MSLIYTTDHKKLILLFSEDTLIWPKVTVKTFTSFYSLGEQKKLLLKQLKTLEQ